MKKIKVVLSSILLASSITSQAGLFKTTVHSRANCLNNESITWWLGHPYKWKVVSIHKHNPTGGIHLVDTGFIYNDRVAAVHWGEGVHGGFTVWGYHYLAGFHDSVPFDTTMTEGCDIIDGWI